MPLRPLSTLRSGLRAASYLIGLLGLIGLLAAPTAPAVAQTLSITEQARQLMDLAERSYPEYFPGHEATRSLAPFAYRYYPLTGAYVGVGVTAASGYTVGDVHVMGGAFGNTPLRVGHIEDFIVPLAARALPRLAVGSGFMLAVQANGAVLSWGGGDSGGAVRALATQPLAGSAAARLPSLGAVTAVASNGGNTQNRIDATSATIGVDGRVQFFGEFGLSAPYTMTDWARCRSRPDATTAWCRWPAGCRRAMTRPAWA